MTPRTVLLVDDDPDILSTLAMCLEGEGYRLVTARHGEEALNCLLAGTRPDALVLDLMMPVMDGWQLVSELDRRGLRHFPLLLMSADRALKNHARTLRADAFFAKPFNLDDLLAELSRLTAAPRPPAA